MRGILTGNGKSARGQEPNWFAITTRDLRFTEAQGDSDGNAAKPVVLSYKLYDDESHGNKMP